MNTPPFSTSRHSPFSPEFLQIILEKSHNFVGRDFIFTAIDDFMHHYQKGYFTIVGVPGSGKSAILAQYVKQNPDTIYYNAQLEGKNRVEEFLKDVCKQLSTWLSNLSSTSPQASLQDNKELLIKNATEGSRLFSLLLQKISERLQPEHKLIIIIDALDTIDISNQPVATNLFYLPRYLPNQVYFIFSRRPYKKSFSGLLIEAPSKILDLSDYPEENRKDIKAYIQKNLLLTPFINRKWRKNKALDFIEKQDKVSLQNFIEGLGESSYVIGKNEDNFMYVYQILKAIAEGFYSENDQFDIVVPNLEAYYKQHWQKMQGEGLSDTAIDLLQILTTAETKPISTLAISKIINADVYDVAEIIENWLEFLQETRIAKESRYKLYNDNFRDWLAKIVQKHF